MDIEYTLEQIPEVVAQLKTILEKSPFIAFFGSMGAGKTTLIKALCKELGVGDNVNSPTFTLVNEYATADGRAVYHFDFYRIKKIEEAYDIGFEEYFYSNGICLIEWPELVEEILPEDIVKAHISILSPTTRQITLE